MYQLYQLFLQHDRCCFDEVKDDEASYAVHQTNRRFPRLRAGVFSKRLDVWYTRFVCHCLVAEIGGWLAQVVFSRGEDALVFLIGVWGDARVAAIMLML